MSYTKGTNSSSILQYLSCLSTKFLNEGGNFQNFTVETTMLMRRVDLLEVAKALRMWGLKASLVTELTTANLDIIVLDKLNLLINKVELRLVSWLLWILMMEMFVTAFLEAPFSFFCVLTTKKAESDFFPTLVEPRRCVVMKVGRVVLLRWPSIQWFLRQLKYQYL